MAEYFEPASRMQLAAKLRHLLRFSDYLLLLVGERGTGRSTLLEQLNPDTDADTRSALIRFDETADVTRLLVTLIEALGIESAPDNRSRLRALHGYARSLRELDIPLLLLIDDADYLTNNALELLANFAVIDDAPRIVLTGTTEFEQRFHGTSLEQLLDGQLHVQLLQPFESEEAQEFIDTLLPSGTAIPARQVRQLIDRAEGLPGALQAGVQTWLREGAASSRKASAVPLSAPYLVGVGVILLAIVAISLWAYWPQSNAGSGPEETKRIALPLDVPVPAKAGQSDKVIDVKNALAKRLAEQEAQQNVAPEAPPATESQRVQAEPRDNADSGVTKQVVVPDAGTPSQAAPAAPVAAKADPAEKEAPKPPVEAPSKPTVVEPTPKPSVVETPAAAKTPASTPKTEKRVQASEPNKTPEKTIPAPVAAQPSVALREKELLKWPDKGYTLQMLGARSVKSVEKFIAARQQPQRFYYFMTTYKGAPWHVVVYGQFESRAAAMNAIASLPLALRKLRPWPRSISGVKADIEKNKQ